MQPLDRRKLVIYYFNYYYHCYHWTPFPFMRALVGGSDGKAPNIDMFIVCTLYLPYLYDPHSDTNHDITMLLGHLQSRQSIPNPDQRRIELFEYPSKYHILAP